MRHTAIALLAVICWMASLNLVPAAASCVPPGKDEVKPVTIASKSRDGEPVSIAAYLMRPSGDGPFPAVVLLHASGGFQPGYLCIAEKIAGWGYVVLAIDSDSAPSRNPFQSNGDFLDTEQAQDAHQGRLYLSVLPYVRGDRVVVLGWSAGGDATLSAVSSNKTFYNGEHFGVDKDGAFAAAVAFYPDCRDELKDLDAPLLLLIGEKDSTASASFCEAMSLVGQTEHGVELKIYPDAQHGFDGPWGGWTRPGAAADDARQRIRRFFAEHLR